LDLQQKPVELMRCRTAQLGVPASSEIVIEGFIHPGVRVRDGPFLDYCGIPDTDSYAFLFEAIALMSRTDPVFRRGAIGMSGAEDH
jgi:4-hydroxy-3-polyprenylbenzoate decarboxylase